MLPTFPIALIIPMAAARFAGGRGIVLLIQASITNPEAYPAMMVSLASVCDKEKD
jgi:hypothetical protein